MVGSLLFKLAMEDTYVKRPKRFSLVWVSTVNNDTQYNDVKLLVKPFNRPLISYVSVLSLNPSEYLHAYFLS